MSIDFTGPNKWRRVYFNTFRGDSQNKKIRAPLIAPFELPLLFQQHILAITVVCSIAPPRWKTSGYLKQVYSGINLETTPELFTIGSPASGVDAASKRIGLNTLELIKFPKLANDFYLWFDPVPWLPVLSLALWEFQGKEVDDLVELIETVKVDLVRIEEKINADYK